MQFCKMRSLKLSAVLVLFVTIIVSMSVVVNGAGDDICYLPVDPGLCGFNFLRYYYNAPSNSCKTFYYGGCLGNSNRFQ